MSNNCDDCKLINPKCRVCGDKNMDIQLTLECDKHRLIRICGNYDKECSKCRNEGYKFITGIGTTIFSYMGENYDPYSLKNRPFKSNFEDGKLKKSCIISSDDEYEKF